MTHVVRSVGASLLALSVAVVVAGSGEQTSPASIAITGLQESVAAGSPVSFTVTALDDAGVPVVGYVGTVHFTSSGADTAMPDDYTFDTRDRGSHSFAFTPSRLGKQTIDVSDAVAGLRRSESTRVGPTAAPQLVSKQAPPVTPGAGDNLATNDSSMAIASREPRALRRAPATPSAAAVEMVRPAEAAPGTAAYADALPVRVAAATGGNLYFVAHQDDDLLFMNPDVEDSIRKELRVRTVFLTAAGSLPGSPPSSWQGREDAVYNTYAAMANAPTGTPWTCATQTYLTNKAVRVCTLNAHPLVSVVFMRLPDGGDPVHQPGLAALWGGPPFGYPDVPPVPVASLTSFTRPEGNPTPTSTYTRAELINTVAAIVADFVPDRIGIQDATLAYGDDHKDHFASALFALDADHLYPGPRELRMYRGYNMYLFWTPQIPSPEVANLSQAQHDEKVRIMEIYGGPMPPTSPWLPFCWQRYAIERLYGGTGQLVTPDGKCIDVGNNPADGTPAAAVPCSDASTRWTVTAEGHIVDAALGIGPGPAHSVSAGTADIAADAKPAHGRHRLPSVSMFKCLVVDADGVTVRVSACTGSLAQTWTLLSNGQIRGKDATCLTVGPDAVALHAALCQPDTSTDKYKPIASQRWVQQMGSPATWSSEFSDVAIGNPAVYASSFRLGDVNGDGYADACIRLSGGVFCALNTNVGSFNARQLYAAAFSDGAGWLPDKYGSTIQLADVNGDGKADVCGRRIDGIVCATANADGSGFGDARLWSTGADFSDAQGWGALASYYGSIRLADVNGDGYADVCGRSASGIVCALNNKAGGFAAASLWIADFTDTAWQPDPYGTTIQFGDINGDGKADVCGRGPDGVRCATANASGTAFTDAHKWSLRTDFSDADGWGASAAYYGSLRLADIDGDGYADLCGRSPNGIVCAISNGGGFDAALAVMPLDYTDALGWGSAPYGATIQFSELNHDGRRDVCGRGPAGLVCATAP